MTKVNTFECQLCSANQLAKATEKPFKARPILDRKRLWSAVEKRTNAQ